MPLLDGIQFLNLLGKRYPELKKVTLTAYATEEKRSQCLAAGAELVIEKPHTPDGFKSVFAMLDDLMNWAPQQGFQGMLRRVGLQDVIQMECLGRNSSVLEVYNEHVLGRIYIENGSIIHAAGGELTGERALQRLLALPGGSFELVPFELPPENTISGPWEFLLMEAARVRDETAAANRPRRTGGGPADARRADRRLRARGGNSDLFRSGQTALRCRLRRRARPAWRCSKKSRSRPRSSRKSCRSEILTAWKCCCPMAAPSPRPGPTAWFLCALPTKQAHERPRPAMAHRPRLAAGNARLWPAPAGWQICLPQRRRNLSGGKNGKNSRPV